MGCKEVATLPHPDQGLRSLCEPVLLRFAQGQLADVHADIHWDGHHYEGLDLLCDEANRVLAVAFCWDAARLRRTRDNFTLFTAACTFAQVYKKPHLVLFHAPELGEVLADWPVGISVTPIALQVEAREKPPRFVTDKLASLMFANEDETAAALANPPDWRRFLTPERVELLMRELAHNQELPPSLRQEVEAVLKMAHGDPVQLRDDLAKYLAERWRAGV